MSGVPPIISECSRPFWDGLAQQRITIQRCDGCAAWVFYPRPFCPECGGRQLTWAEVDGDASLYTFTIAHVPVAKAFAHLDKPVLAVAELASGVRLPTMLVDTDPARLKIGMPLLPVFDSTSHPEATLLHFRAAD